MLQVENLCKSYRGIPAIRGVSFQVGEGEIVGYLGPNGSGKSTTVKIITAMLKPSDGRVLFKGRNILDDLPGFRSTLGYVPEEAHVDTHLSGLEYLELIGRLRELPETLIQSRAHRMLELFGLHAWRYTPLSFYSKGMKQRVLIASALLHNPQLLVFDEPLSGLDVVSARLFKDLLDALSAEGKAILYISHALEVVEQVCHRVIVLSQGTIRGDASPAELKQMMHLPDLKAFSLSWYSRSTPGRLRRSWCALWEATMLRRHWTGPVVLSLYKLAETAKQRRPQSSFRVLVEHLFGRLLSSASLDPGDDASVSFFAQAAYAVALPTMLFALYLFPAYHQPHGKPSFWIQTTHHFFYVEVSFAVMGIATVLVWDLLFPDPSDVLILGSLPTSTRRLLAARVVALTLLLGGILLGTSFLGIIFFPATADLTMRFPWHFLVHAAAVWTAGACGAFSVILLQAAAVCLLPRRIEQALSPILQIVCVLLFTLVLVLEPIFATLLQPAFTSTDRWYEWFPPFWFLGLYESLLYYKQPPVLFMQAAKLGFAATTCLLLAVLLMYPLAFLKRMRQAIENAQQPRRPFAALRGLTRLLTSLLLRDGRTRATFFWISQTVLRIRRTRLLLSFFSALVLGAPFAVLALGRVYVHTAEGPLLMQLAELSIPASAFLMIAGLRTALRAPVARGGAWVFRVVSGLPGPAHRRGTELWVALAASLLSALLALLTSLAIPTGLRGQWNLSAQALLGVILSLLLAKLFLLRERSTPFTEFRERTVNDLSFAVVTYFVLFPVAALALVAAEPWIAISRVHTTTALLFAGLAYLVLVILKHYELRGVAEQATVMEEEQLLPGEVGLRT